MKTLILNIVYLRGEVPIQKWRQGERAHSRRMRKPDIEFHDVGWWCQVWSYRDLSRSVSVILLSSLEVLKQIPTCTAQDSYVRKAKSPSFFTRSTFWSCLRLVKKNTFPQQQFALCYQVSPLPWTQTPLSLLSLIQPHHPPCCKSNMPDIAPPQGTCLLFPLPKISFPRDGGSLQQPLQILDQSPVGPPPTILLKMYSYCPASGIS